MKQPTTPRARWIRVGLALLATLGVASAAWAGWQRTSRHDAGAAVSYDPHTKLLRFTLPRFAGGQLSTQALRGRPVVVNFYASWCGICRQEMPDFERFSQEIRGRITVIGVNPQSNDNDASQAALVLQTGVTYPTVRDRGDALLRLFDPSGALPTTVFLDASGRVERVVDGQLTEGQLTRIAAADFGIEVTHTLGDRSAPRTGPPPVSRHPRR